MRIFGLGILGQALHKATFSELMNGFAHPLSVTIAAQSAEILIKARIAQEHPLLIFTTLPKSLPDGRSLNIESLLESGRSADYFELPNLLWATTGYQIPDRLEYERFGRLRNQIQHLTFPLDENLADRTLQFIFRVIAPMAKDFWQVNVVATIEEVDPDGIEYVEERLTALGLPFDEVEDLMPELDP